MSGRSCFVSGTMAKLVAPAVVVALTIFAVLTHEWIALALVIAAVAPFVSVSVPVSGSAGVLARSDVAPVRIPTPSRHPHGQHAHDVQCDATSTSCIAVRQLIRAHVYGDEL